MASALRGSSDAALLAPVDPPLVVGARSCGDTRRRTTRVRAESVRRRPSCRTTPRGHRNRTGGGGALLGARASAGVLFQHTRARIRLSEAALCAGLRVALLALDR